MNSKKTVLLKGELHSSAADLRQEKTLLADDVDVLVIEGGQPSTESRFTTGWFSVSIALLTWILASLYQSKDLLVDLAGVRGTDVVYTRPDDVAPLAQTSTTMKAISAGLFYTLIPASLWIGFVTRSHLAGSLLLFLGLVLPVFVVRIYNVNRTDVGVNRDQLIAETIVSAGSPGDRVLAIVGAGHLHEVERRLPDSIDVEVTPPAYDAWSASHVKSVGLPTVKAGFVLFSLYVLCSWIVVQVVTNLSPFVISIFG